MHVLLSLQRELKLYDALSEFTAPCFGGSLPAADVTIDARNTGADGGPTGSIGASGHVELTQQEPHAPKYSAV